MPDGLGVSYCHPRNTVPSVRCSRPCKKTQGRGTHTDLGVGIRKSWATLRPAAKGACRNDGRGNRDRRTSTVCPRLPPSMTTASAILSHGFCAAGSFEAVPLTFAFLISDSTY